MGLYLEPKGSKLQWAQENGTAVPPGSFSPKMSGKMVVAWMNNGPFQALAIIFSKTEAKRIMLGRPDAVWFEVPVDALKPLMHPGEFSRL